MLTSHEIAISIYEEALEIFARRVGRVFVSATAVEPLTTDILQSSKNLALPQSSRSDLEGLYPLISVMGGLHQQEMRRYYHPQRISTEETIVLPQESISPDLETMYDAVWLQCNREYQTFTASTDRHVQEANLHALLQRYTWAMPAPDANDVSLFDYARVCAAVAVCLSASENRSEPPVLLVGGDVSGVQEWLYTFSSRGAAKSLRGRSFYLQLLSEVIAQYILDTLDLPSANLLYAGGGNFYLLAPPIVADKIPELRRDISQRMLTMHEGSLYVVIAAAEMTTDMLTGQNEQDVGDAWRAVGQQLGRLKARRFSELSNKQMAMVIGSPSGRSGHGADVCTVCGRDIHRDQGEETEVLEGEPDRHRCGQCLSFAQVGNDLRTADFLVLSRNTLETKADETKVDQEWDWAWGLHQFGYDVALLKSHQLAGELRRKNAAISRVFYWQEGTSLPPNVPMHNLVYGFRPLAQCVPLTRESDPEDPKKQTIADFDQLESDGLGHWGVLRMDVDRLGQIFQRGLQASDLCHVASVSGLMRLFFEGVVPHLAAQFNVRDGEDEHQVKQSTIQPRIYLMYAGGDDLFVVGGWSDLPHLALAIQQKFQEFACQNPQVTISGGISIAPSVKYPLYQAARDAGSAEEAAKDSGRNAINFLRETVSWGTHFDQVVARVERLKEWVRWRQNPQGKLPRGFISTLRSIEAEWRTWRMQEDRPDGKPGRYLHQSDLFIGPWMWHMIYLLNRHAERTDDCEIRDYVKDYCRSIVGGEIRRLGLTARWIEFLTRAEEA